MKNNNNNNYKNKAFSMLTATMALKRSLCKAKQEKVAKKQAVRTQMEKEKDKLI